MTRKIGQLTLALAISLASASYAHAFGGQTCGGDCKDCHTLSKEEAVKLLKTEDYRFEVKDVRLAPIG
ncbi:MAG: hypothetical protein HY880_02575, partial [Deltaproteobacteria bacterium]|nr:hypothetical protein [Deltaproteobacteria bacterium]